MASEHTSRIGTYYHTERPSGVVDFQKFPASTPHIAASAVMLTTGCTATQAEAAIAALAEMGWRVPPLESTDQSVWHHHSRPRCRQHGSVWQAGAHARGSLEGVGREHCPPTPPSVADVSTKVGTRKIGSD
jgi:hypothetical protein